MIFGTFQKNRETRIKTATNETSRLRNYRKKDCRWYNTFFSTTGDFGRRISIIKTIFKIRNYGNNSKFKTNQRFKH